MVGISGISIPNLSYYGAGGGRMSLPVDSGSLVYSYFEHVSGIPAPTGTQGLAISKLNLLDVLITQINRISREEASLGSGGIGDGSTDSVIENLANQVRQAEENHAAMPYTPSPSAHAGAVFSLTV